jgi:hypothetical protein
MDEALGTGTALEDAWDDLLRSTGYPPFFMDYTRAESSAAFLRAFEVMYVYGLFQTEAYLRTMLQVEASVDARIRRQKVLQRETPPMVSVVLAEATLWTCMGSPGIMREQCEHLLAVSEWRNVTLQVAPLGHFTAFAGSFNLATQPNGNELLYMPTARGGTTTKDRGDILHIVSNFSALQANALSTEDSREFLRKAVERWTKSCGVSPDEAVPRAMRV